MITNKLLSFLIKIHAVGAVVFFTGCQHNLAIKNLDSYRMAGVVSEKPISVGLVVKAPEPSVRLGDGIASGLRNCATEVIYPYSPSVPRKVDVHATVGISPTYKGSEANF